MRSRSSFVVDTNVYPAYHEVRQIECLRRLDP